MSDITLYFARASRGFIPRWLLEELGIDYRVETLDLKAGEQKRPAFLAVNPMGKVPALTDGAVVVTEAAAICLYLADRYGYGSLAPRVDAPARGPYLRWSLFASAVVEPALWLDEPRDPKAASGRGWGDREAVVGALRGALTPGPWLLGDAFSAADVVLGSTVSFALLNARLPPEPVFAAYRARMDERPAHKRAAAATWGA